MKSALSFEFIVFKALTSYVSANWRVGAGDLYPSDDQILIQSSELYHSKMIQIKLELELEIPNF